MSKLVGGYIPIEESCEKLACVWVFPGPSHLPYLIILQILQCEFINPCKLLVKILLQCLENLSSV